MTIISSMFLREKLSYPELRRRIMDHSLAFGAASVIIEDKGSGISLIQDIRRQQGGRIVYAVAFTPEGDKVTRMYAQSAKIEAGHVYLPRKAHWLEDFRSELMQFQKGRYDDQVDSVSQFLNWLELRNLRTCFVQECFV